MTFEAEETQGRRRRPLVVWLAAAILMACGGGGGGDAPTAGDTALSPQTGAISRYGDIERAAAFTILNAIRVGAGLGELFQSPALDNAAQGHADYLSLNDALGNFQSPAAPGFTGASPTDRTAAAGYVHDYLVELQSSATVPRTAASMLDGLMSAPYRRTALLRYRTSDVGLGYNVEFPTSLVVILAHSPSNPQGAPTLAAAVWPPDGAVRVPRSGCCDAPDPMPELAGQPWGFPVSVHTHEFRTLAVQTFTLTDDAGTVVASRLLTSDSDAQLAATRSRHVALLMPLAPLNASARYTARFVGTIDGTAFEREWQFTTGTE